MGLSVDQEEIVNGLANRMRYIRFDGHPLGVEGARKRLLDWIGNFAPFLEDLKPCFEMLRNIEILNDQEIFDGCTKLLADHFELSEYAYKYTCFGSAYESSARIIRQINSQEEYEPELEDLLFSEEVLQNKKPLVVFVDDFLNSGQQFENILNVWRQGEAPGRAKRSRKSLKTAAWQKLKQVDIVFVFDRCMEEGRQRAEAYVKRLGLKAKILCRNTYQDRIGIFGDENDAACIRREIKTQVSENSIFRGWACSDLTGFLRICELAGEALLRAYKPHWPEGRFAERKLGYGNSAKLYFTEANVPTCTLTCIWLGGRITIDGREVDWKPILPRREKKEAGCESDAPKKSMNGWPKADVGGGLLDEYKLDTDPSKSSPFEICLFVPVSHAPAVFPEKYWQCGRPESRQGTLAYTGLLRPELIESLGFSSKASGAESSVQVLRPYCLSTVNQHLVCAYDNNEYPAKLMSGLMVVFGGVAAFCVARLRLNLGLANIRVATDIARRLMFLEKSQARLVPLNQKSPNLDGRVHANPNLHSTTIPALLAWIQGHADQAGPKTELFAGDFQPYSIERARSMVYMRERGPLFHQDPATQLAITKLAANFARSGKNTSIPPKDISCISLDKDAHIGIGHYGAVVLCGGEAGINTSYLASDFMQHYLYLYLFALHLELTCVRLRSAGRDASDEVWAKKARSWLRRFVSFPLDRACQRPYMQQFLSELESRMSIKDLVTETHQVLGTQLRSS